MHSKKLVLNQLFIYRIYSLRQRKFIVSVPPARANILMKEVGPARAETHES